ncbi:uncharacterized protein LOC143252400 isoform X2 [Tachypleus tridentatus]|uniref:uncharacterized protein LOC143252400 isoform X2 n=1 Tax=Tachypleus tridentatus TaxID=6853 RepID=UPI003FD5E459
MRVQTLPAEVICKLRSDVAITSVCHCVEELVLNALDAGASCVAARLDLPHFKVQVVDNGHGIPPDQLELIGERYTTSKCHTIEDLNKSKFYGYRGEALSSLQNLSGFVEITSCSKNNQTYSKLFNHGHPTKVFKSCQQRPSIGTTVSVSDFMYNQPVRRKCILEALEFDSCRQTLAAIALIHPQVSFSLRNDATGEICLQTHKSQSVLKTFEYLFGVSKAKHLREVSHISGAYQIKGFISTKGQLSKDLQFVYVNKRLVLKSKIHKEVNTMLSKNICRQKDVSSPTVLTSAVSKSRRNCNLQSVYMLNLSCPLGMYDISFEPRKTLVEFCHWDTVASCIFEAISGFLKNNNLFLSPQLLNNTSTYQSGDNEFTKSGHQGQQKTTKNKVIADCHEFTTEDMKAVLFSMKAKRLQKEKILETGDDENEPDSFVTKNENVQPSFSNKNPRFNSNSEKNVLLPNYLKKHLCQADHVYVEEFPNQSQTNIHPAVLNKNVLENCDVGPSVVKISEIQQEGNKNRRKLFLSYNNELKNHLSSPQTLKTTHNGDQNFVNTCLDGDISKDCSVSNSNKEHFPMRRPIAQKTSGFCSSLSMLSRRKNKDKKLTQLKEQFQFCSRKTPQRKQEAFVPNSIIHGSSGSILAQESNSEKCLNKCFKMGRKRDVSYLESGYERRSYVTKPMGNTISVGNVTIMSDEKLSEEGFNKDKSNKEYSEYLITSNVSGNNCELNLKNSMKNLSKYGPTVISNDKLNQMNTSNNDINELNNMKLVQKEVETSSSVRQMKDISKWDLVNRKTQSRPCSCDTSAGCKIPVWSTTNSFISSYKDLRENGHIIKTSSTNQSSISFPSVRTGIFAVCSIADHSNQAQNMNKSKNYLSADTSQVGIHETTVGTNLQTSADAFQAGIHETIVRTNLQTSVDTSQAGIHETTVRTNLQTSADTSQAGIHETTVRTNLQTSADAFQAGIHETIVRTNLQTSADTSQVGIHETAVRTNLQTSSPIHFCNLEVCCSQPSTALKNTGLSFTYQPLLRTDGHECMTTPIYNQGKTCLNQQNKPKIGNLKNRHESYQVNDKNIMFATLKPEIYESNTEFPRKLSDKCIVFPSSNEGCILTEKACILNKRPRLEKLCHTSNSVFARHKECGIFSNLQDFEKDQNKSLWKPESSIKTSSKSNLDHKSCYFRSYSAINPMVYLQESKHSMSKQTSNGESNIRNQDYCSSSSAESSCKEKIIPKTNNGHSFHILNQFCRDKRISEAINDCSRLSPVDKINQDKLSSGDISNPDQLLPSNKSNSNQLVIMNNNSDQVSPISISNTDILSLLESSLDSVSPTSNNNADTHSFIDSSISDRLTYVNSSNMDKLLFRNNCNLNKLSPTLNNNQSRMSPTNSSKLDDTLFTKDIYQIGVSTTENPDEALFLQENKSNKMSESNQNFKTRDTLISTCEPFSGERHLTLYSQDKDSLEVIQQLKMHTVYFQDSVERPASFNFTETRVLYDNKCIEYMNSGMHERVPELTDENCSELTEEFNTSTHHKDRRIQLYRTCSKGVVDDRNDYIYQDTVKLPVAVDEVRGYNFVPDSSSKENCIVSPEISLASDNFRQAITSSSIAPSLLKLSNTLVTLRSEFCDQNGLKDYQSAHQQESSSFQQLEEMLPKGNMPNSNHISSECSVKNQPRKRFRESLSVEEDCSCGKYSNLCSKQQSEEICCSEYKKQGVTPNVSEDSVSTTSSSEPSLKSPGISESRKENMKYSSYQQNAESVVKISKSMLCDNLSSEHNLDHFIEDHIQQNTKTVKSLNLSSREPCEHTLSCLENSSENCKNTSGIDTTEPYSLYCRPVIYQKSEHKNSCLEVDVCEGEYDQWLCWVDPISGQEMYINRVCGNSTYLPPPSGKNAEENKSSICGESRQHFFLSHNSSPFLKKKENMLTTVGKSVDNIYCLLNNCLKEQLTEDLGRKWRVTKEEVENYKLSLDNVTMKFKEWSNPVFQNTHLQEVCNMNLKQYPKNVTQVYNIIRPYRFGKFVFQNFEVVGQVDNKFIACLVPSSEQSLVKDLLVLFDQHAVHERIRLEQLMDELYNTMNSKHVASSCIHPPLELPFEPDLLHLIKAFIPQLEKLGITITYEASNNSMVKVHTVPSCILEKEVNEVKRGRKPVIANLVENLIREQMELCKQTQGASGALPKTLIYVLNSQACHGAVKFGDELDNTECIHLIKSLTYCKLPFQCAHGRPSLTPLVDFSYLQSNCDKQSTKPQLWKIKNKLELRQQ